MKKRPAGPEFVIFGGCVLSDSRQHRPSNEAPGFVKMALDESYQWQRCYVDITRSVAFFDGLTFENDSIFDPRQDRVVPILEDEQVYMCRQMLPMIEHMVSEAGNKAPFVLDVGTGGGVFAIWAAQHGCNVLAVDINPRALRTAVVNAERNLGKGCVVDDLSKIGDTDKGKICFRRDRFGADFKSDRKFDIVILAPPFNPTPEGLHPALHAFAGEDGQLCFNEQIQAVPFFLRDGGVCLGVHMTTVSGDDNTYGNIDAFDRIRESFSQSGFSANYALVFEPLKKKGARFGISIEGFLIKTYSNFMTDKNDIKNDEGKIKELFYKLTNNNHREFAYIYFQIVKGNDKQNFFIDKPFNKQKKQFGQIKKLGAVDEVDKVDENQKRHIWDFRTFVHRNIVENVSLDSEFVPSYHIFNAGSLNENLRIAVSNKEPLQDIERKLEFGASEDFIEQWNKSIIRLADAYIRRHELCSEMGRNFDDTETFFDTIIINSAPYYKSLQGMSSLTAQSGFWMKCDCFPESTTDSDNNAARGCHASKETTNPDKRICEKALVFVSDVMKAWRAITPAFQKSGKALYQHPRFTGLLTAEKFTSFNSSRFDYSGELEECEVGMDKDGAVIRKWYSVPDMFKSDSKSIEKHFEKALSDIMKDESLLEIIQKLKDGEIQHEIVKKIIQDIKKVIAYINSASNKTEKDIEEKKIDLTLRTGELCDILRAICGDSLTTNVKQFLEEGDKIRRFYLFKQYYNYVRYFYDHYLKKLRKQSNLKEEVNHSAGLCEQGLIHGYEHDPLKEQEMAKQYEQYLSDLMKYTDAMDERFREDEKEFLQEQEKGRRQRDHRIIIKHVIPGLQRNILYENKKYFDYIDEKGIYNIELGERDIYQGLEDIFEMDLKLSHEVLHSIMDDTITDMMKNKKYKCPKSIRSSAFIGVPLSFSKGIIYSNKNQSIPQGELPTDYKGGVWVYVNSSNKWTPQMERALLDLVKFLSVIHIDFFSGEAIGKGEEFGKVKGESKAIFSLTHNFTGKMKITIRECMQYFKLLDKHKDSIPKALVESTRFRNSILQLAADFYSNNRLIDDEFWEQTVPQYPVEEALYQYGLNEMFIKLCDEYSRPLAEERAKLGSSKTRLKIIRKPGICVVGSTISKDYFIDQERMQVYIFIFSIVQLLKEAIQHTERYIDKYLLDENEESWPSIIVEIRDVPSPCIIIKNPCIADEIKIYESKAICNQDIDVKKSNERMLSWEISAPHIENNDGSCFWVREIKYLNKDN